MILKLPRGEEVETDEHTIVELEELLEHMQVLGQKLAARIREAASKAAEGEFSDAEWFSSLKMAKSINARTCEKLKVIISQRRKAQRATPQPSASKSAARFFVELCRERMKSELFDALMAEAIRLKEAAQLEANRVPQTE